MLKHGLFPLILLASSLSACQTVDSLLIGVGGTPKPGASASVAPSGLPSLPRPTAMPAPPTTSAQLSYPALHPVPFTAKGNPRYLQRWNGKAYENFYIKGVNLGIGLPGTQAGDLAATREHYANWFAQMGKMGVNSLRIYTLHFPHFYEELARYNAAHPEQPIYLFHGIWLDEEDDNNQPHTQLHQVTGSFERNIREAVDVVHGKASIGSRRGRAWGNYRSDISRWVAGWIIGREIIPEEIVETNKLFASETSFQGKHVRLPQGNPSEVWLSQRVDLLLDYERSRYQVDRPISCSSWPTLDPLEHPTENPLDSSEDITQIDLAQLETFDAPAGYFASFHAYPYYPNFMVNDPVYNQASDSEGLNNYVGYLKALKAHYSQIPLVIAEYGVPSSWGNAHFSPSKMDHGGHSEEGQAHYNARMTRNLYETDTAGGMIFAWIDEWWKRTWIVDEITYPRERYRLWHNLTSPEENFGIIAFEPPAPVWYTLPESASAPVGSPVSQIQAAYDTAYFRLKLQLKDAYQNGERLVIGFDTYRDDLGDPVLPDMRRTGHRHELALDLSLPAQAQLYVTQSYDLLGIWHRASGPEQLYQSKAVNGAPWLPVRWQNDQYHSSKDGSMSFPIKYFEIGQLHSRRSSEPASSLDAVVVSDKEIELRIPWALLQFADPSTRSVVHDERSTPGRESLVSEGIAVSLSYRGQVIDTSRRFSWSSWDQVPPTTEREKPTYKSLQDTFSQLPEIP